MNARLYDIADDYAAIMDLVYLADGEVTDEIAERLDEAETDLEKKVDATCRVRQCFLDEAAALDAEIARLKKRKDARTKAAKGLTSYLNVCFTVGGVKKLKTEKYTVYQQRNPGRLVLDEERVPERFTEEVTTIRIRKDEIKAALKDGEELGFARIEQGEIGLRVK